MAGEVALHSALAKDIEMSFTKFAEMARKWGLTASTLKTKEIVLGEGFLTGI